MPFGKYEGKSIQYIKDTEPKYYDLIKVRCNRYLTFGEVRVIWDDIGKETAIKYDVIEQAYPVSYIVKILDISIEVFNSILELGFTNMKFTKIVTRRGTDIVTKYPITEIEKMRLINLLKVKGDFNNNTIKMIGEIIGLQYMSYEDIKKYYKWFDFHLKRGRKAMFKHK